MSPLTLITGPAASGRTGFLLTALARLYEADPFTEACVLVPTVRHGDQFRRRLVTRCGVVLALRVQTLAQLSREHAAGALVADGVLWSELLRASIDDAISNGLASYFSTLAGSSGLRRQIATAIGELLGEQVEPAALQMAAETSDEPVLTALAAVYGACVAELDELGWMHPAQLPAVAAGDVRSGAPVPALVAIDDFQTLSAGEMDLIAALSSRTQVLCTLDPAAGERSRHALARLLETLPDAERVELSAGAAVAPVVLRGESADREAQLRAMAREVKQRLTDEPGLRPSDCVIAFRQITPYLGLARQVFAEYDLPLDPAAGESLASRPLGAWLRRLLHLASGGWRLRDLVAVLASGFSDRARWGLDRGDVARVARYGRERHLWAGTAALGRIVEALRVDAAAPATSEPMRVLLVRGADGLAAALTEFDSLLSRGIASAADHAGTLDRVLFGPRPLVRPGARELRGVETEIEALRGYLRSIASADRALSAAPISFEAFVAVLEEMLEAPGVLLREAGGVLLAPLHTLHGLRFAHVAIGGLIEGEFPAPRTATALLDREAREALNRAGLALPPEPRATEDELWGSASSRADATLSLWRSRLDERGRPASASFYFDSVAADVSVDAGAVEPHKAASRREQAIASTQEWQSGGQRRPRGLGAWPVVRRAVEVEQQRRSFEHAGVFEGRLGPDLVPELTGPDAVWSASRLESYLTCSFQFFGQYALRLRELDEEQDSADAATRGSVIHAVLQDALAPLVAAGEPLTPETVDQVVRRLHGEGPAIWNGAPTRYGFGRAALWRLDAEDAFAQMEALLGREAEASAARGVSRVLGTEVQMRSALPLDPPLEVTAGIDRVDLGPDLAVIVDYKSGRDISRSQLADGRRVQLQLYGYLARQTAQMPRIVARYAVLNPRSAPWDLDTARAADAALIDGVVEVAERVRNAVSSGDFRVNPQVPTCPGYCAFIHVCRVNELSRWKRWD